MHAAATIPTTNESFSAVESRYYRDLRLSESVSLALTERIIAAMQQGQPQLVVMLLARKLSDDATAGWRSFRSESRIDSFVASFVRFAQLERTRVELPDVGVTLHDSLGEYNLLMRIIFNLEERHLAWYIIHAHVKTESVPSLATLGGRIAASLGYTAHSKLETFELVVDFPLTKHLARQPTLERLKSLLPLAAAAPVGRGEDASISWSSPALMSMGATHSVASQQPERQARSGVSSGNVSLPSPRAKKPDVSVLSARGASLMSSSSSSSGVTLPPPVVVGSGSGSGSGSSSSDSAELVEISVIGDSDPGLVPAPTTPIPTRNSNSNGSLLTMTGKDASGITSGSRSGSRSTSTDKSCFIAVNLARRDSSASLSTSRDAAAKKIA